MWRFESSHAHQFFHRPYLSSISLIFKTRVACVIFSVLLIFSPSDSIELIARPKSHEDGVVPSGNGVALRVLRKLARFPDIASDDRSRFSEAAAGSLNSFGFILEQAPFVVGNALIALAESSESAMPESKDVVKVTIESTSEDTVLVHLEIQEGWHIHSNPPTSEDWIPVTVMMETEGAIAEVSYPEGTEFQTEFSEESISVYRSSVEIPVRFASEKPRDSFLRVGFQACDDATCVRPSTKVVALP